MRLEIELSDAQLEAIAERAASLMADRESAAEPCNEAFLESWARELAKRSLERRLADVQAQVRA
jgi:hypothetical protein